MAVKFFEIKDQKMIFTGDYMEAYIPSKIYKSLVEEDGEILKIMGVFNFRIGKNREVDPNSELFTFNFPSMFFTAPSIIDKQILTLLPEKNSNEYFVLKYYKGDLMMTSTEIIKDISNVEKFVSLLLNGYIPSTVKYSDILRMFYRNLEINGETANVSGTLLSGVVSELCRYSGDQSIPVRKMIGKGKAGELDYSLANARTVCANNSTFSALTFEDVDTMLVYAIDGKRRNRKENISPLEKLIQI